MYIFKFTTLDKRKDKLFKGNFPSEYAQELWNDNIKFVIISTYSNTIKVPRKVDFNDYNENLVEFDEFPLTL